MTDKEAVRQQELAKLQALFKECEPSKAKLAEGLVETAAFLYAESVVLRKLIDQTGSVKVHPQNSSVQKITEAAKMLDKITNTYSVVVKALNGILSKSQLEEEDDLGDFE